VGIFYGFSHQRTITASQRAEHERHEYESKQKLINQAKAEYAKLKNPAQASADDGTTSRCLVPQRRARPYVPGAMPEIYLAAPMTIG
jgi:hypothetical protein